MSNNISLLSLQNFKMAVFERIKSIAFEHIANASAEILGLNYSDIFPDEW
jgi:hypothetical protein